MSSVTVEINGRETVSQAALQASGSMKKMGDDSKGFLKGITITAGDVVDALQGIHSAVSSFLDAFSVQQTALATLSQSVGNNLNLTAGAMERLVDYSGELQAKSIYGDEELQKQASYLSSLQLTEEQIRNVLSASVDMASSGLMPLDTAVKNIAKTFGGMAGELGEKIPALRELTAEQLKAGEAVDLLAKNFAGYAESAVNTLAGTEAQINNIIGDIQEKIGGVFGV